MNKMKPAKEAKRAAQMGITVTRYRAHLAARAKFKRDKRAGKIPYQKAYKLPPDPAIPKKKRIPKPPFKPMISVSLE